MIITAVRSVEIILKTDKIHILLYNRRQKDKRGKKGERVLKIHLD